MLFCISAVSMNAQQVLEGTVYNIEKVPLSGVTIKVQEDTTLVAITGNDGRYSLLLPSDNVSYTIVAHMFGMRISWWGMKSSEERLVHDFVLREKIQNLGTVVVTATRTPKLLMDVPMVTRVIDARDIQVTDAGTVQELLQVELPGIEFSYTMNQQVNLNMQGFGGNSVLFLVDGERLAGETMDNVDYARLTLENVERIEVVKGAASSLYGSNAVGGVVNLISSTINDPWTLSIGARYGSFNDGRYNGNFSFNCGKISSVTNAQYVHTDPIHLSDSGDIHNIYGTHSFNTKERLLFRINDRLKVNARAGYFFRERESAVVSHERYRDFSGGTKVDYAINDSSDISLSYSFDQYDKSDYACLSGADVRDYSNVQHSLRGIASHVHPTFGTLTAGGDAMRDYLMSYQFAAPGYHEQYTADAFMQWDWNVSEKLNVVTSFRYDYFSKANASHLSPKLNIMYKIDEVTLRATYANGFRAPTLKEMYMNFDMANIFMIYGNADLKPEVSNNANFSVEWNHNACHITTLAFYNYVENRITTMWNIARNGMVYDNMAPVNIYGVDFAASARWDNGIGARLSYVYTHESVDENGLNTSETRPHTATIRVDYRYAWRRGVSVIALNGRALSAVTSDVYTDLTDLTQHERQTYPGYVMWRLTANHTFKKGVKLTLTIDNLLGYKPEYYYSNSPATVGRTYAAGLSWNIEQAFEKSDED